MVREELYITGAIVVASLFPLTVFFLLGRLGSGHRAVKAFFQAVRWITAGIWVGIVLAGARGFGGVAALVLSMVAIASLTGSEYALLRHEEVAESLFSEEK